MTGIRGAVDSFVRTQSETGRFLEPAVVVGAACVAWALQDVAVLLALGPEAAEIVNAYVVSMVLHAFQPVTVWLLFGGAFYLFVVALGERGRPDRLYELSGWGFATFVPAGVAWAVGKYYAYSGRTVRDLSLREEVDIGVKWNVTRDLEAAVAGDPALVGPALVACLFVLSSAYPWALAIDYATSLDRRRSLVVAAVPTLIYVAYALSRVA